MVEVMMVMAPKRLRQILNIGELAAFGGVRKIGRKLAQLVRCRGIALRLGGLGGIFKIRRNLLGNLLVLRRVRLLHLLEHTQQLGEGGKLAVIGL